MIPTIRKRLSWQRRFSGLATLGLTLCATAAFAAAPTVVVDIQNTDSVGLSSPQSIIVAPNNTIYVADTGNQRILAFVFPYTSAPTVVSTTPYTVATPNALAVDSSGDLFIGDSPTTGTGRVLEALATNGALNGTVNQVVIGGPLQDVFSLTVDTTPTSSTFNTLYIGDDLSSAIYTVAPGGNTPVKLDLTGLPSGIVPAALVKDAAGNLFIADFMTTLYEVPSGSLAAQAYLAPGFILNSPTGLALDPKGDLYILTLGVPFGTRNQTPVQEIVEVPNEDPSSAFFVPLSLEDGSAMALDSTGNVYVTDYFGGNIVALSYGSALNFSLATVGGNGPVIGLNYEFNASVTVRGFKFVSGGDKSTEIVNDGGTCSNGKYNDGNNGNAISPSNPYVCLQYFSPEPAYPGVRESAIELEGPSSTILNTTSVYSLGYAGASVVYPLTASTAASDINSPEGLAVSGLDKKLYIVNAAPGAPQILYANGPDGTTLTTVNTNGVLIGLPIGIAIDAAGDLYVADFAYHLIDIIPASGQTSSSENPGNLLQHPYSVALDPLGNLYIGDAGPEGAGADATNPGYIVEVPADGGAPFKINTGATTIIYPESLAIDPYTYDLYVGDGGDPSENGAKVVKIAAANGATPGAITDVTPSGVTQPVGLALDPAEQLYVLDQNANTITVVPPIGTPYLLPFDNSLFTTPVSLAITNGGQSLVESNVTESTSNNLVYLNGKSSQLAFGSVAEGQQSSTLTATVNNIGNTTLNFLTPYYTSNATSSPFDILGSTTCASGGFLYPTNTCAINVQFLPTSTGNSTEKLTLSTDGYNNGDSVIHLTGRGTTATPTIRGRAAFTDRRR